MRNLFVIFTIQPAEPSIKASPDWQKLEVKAIDYLDYMNTTNPTAIVIGIDQTLETVHSNGISTLYISKDFGMHCALFFASFSYTST